MAKGHGTERADASVTGSGPGFFERRKQPRQNPQLSITEMSDPRYTSSPVKCGHCQNTGIMVIGKSYSQVARFVDESNDEPFAKGDIYDLLECPVCGKITLRKYFWIDYMESEADVTFRILWPVPLDYTAKKERFLPANSPHDAFLEIRRILALAQKSIQIVDPYVDATIFTLLATLEEQTAVSLLTRKRGEPDFDLEAAKFTRQYPNITIAVRLSKDFHDRFIILDEREVFHLGASIKDAGNTACMIQKMEDAGNVMALFEQFRRSWDAAAPVDL